MITPSGGRHRYYRGSLPPTAGKTHHKLGPGVDTRGRGSYVLVPPSYVIEKKKGYEGDYRVEHHLPVAAVPPWIVEATAPKVTEARQAPADVELDTDEAIRQASAWLKLQPRPTQGNASDTLYAYAARLKDLGISQARSIAMLYQFSPDYMMDDIAVRVGNAWKHGQNAPGCDIPQPDNIEYAETLKDAGVSPEAVTVEQAVPTADERQFAELVDIFGTIGELPVLTREMLPDTPAIDYVFDMAERQGVDPVMPVALACLLDP